MRTLFSILLSFLHLLFDKPLEVGMGLQILTERTFLENQRLSNGSPFSQKGPSWKTQVVQWVSVFTQKDLYGKRRFAQWAVIFLGGDFCGNWRWSNWPMLSHEGPSWKMSWSNGPPFSQKGSSWKTQGAQKGLCFHKRIFHGKQKVLQFLSCTRVSCQLKLTKSQT
jgi:hypothetical protein